MDTVMPVRNGFSTTEKIRKLEDERKYDRTFICGFGRILDGREEQNAKSSGMDHFIRMPAEGSEILSIVAKSGCKLFKN